MLSSTSDVSKKNSSSIQPQEHHNNGFSSHVWKSKGNDECSRLRQNKRDNYWTEAVLTLTLLENVSVKKGEMEMPHKKFHASDPRYTNNPHCFGEMAIIKSIKTQR